ncbi:MAG: copper amine oxidase N-terminal domain-containing protein [Eubacteriales bacterium]|jgi:hypothetical protein|nr:copper amine oxidase N-terminal domain-containing protein [Eubacteriales bacterium]
MIQNNRIPPIDRHLQGAAIKKRINTAKKPNTIPGSQNAAPNKKPAAKQVSQGKRIKNSVSASRYNQPKAAPRNVKQKKRRKLTAEEIKLQARRRNEHKQKQKKLKEKQLAYKFKLFKDRLRVYLCRFVVFTAMFIFALLISTLLFFVNLFTNISPQKGVYICQTGGIYDVFDVKTVKGDTIYRNGTFYINVTDIAAYCGFTTTGDIKQIRFISKNKDNDNVRLKIGDAVIYINGVPARLTAPVTAEGDSIFVPVEFFDKYALGINVNIDEQERKITISRAFDETTSNIISEFETENLLRQAKGESQMNVSELSVDIGYGDISFTLRRDEPTEHIDEYTIGRDLLLITDPEYIANLRKLAEENEQSELLN